MRVSQDVLNTQGLPFQAGIPVSTNLFFNRKKELNELKTVFLSIKKGVRQDVALISPRRFGKTSLLLKLKEELEKEDIVVIYFDCSKVFPFSIENFLEIYIKETLSVFCKKEGWKILPSRIADAVAGSPEAVTDVVASLVSIIGVEFGDFMKIWFQVKKREKKPSALFESALDLPERLSKKTGLTTFVIFDEFQLLKEFDKDFFWALRARMQEHKRTAYAIAGSSIGLMNEIVSSKGSPFYNMFLVRTLKPFEDKDAIDFLKQRFKSANFSIDEDGLVAIMEKSGNIPFYLQWLGLNSYLLALHLKKRTITKEIVDSAYANGLLTIPQFEREFGVFTKNQQMVLIIMALKKFTRLVDIAREMNKRETNISRELRELVRYGYVIKTKDGYKILDQVFADWLRMRFS